MAIYNSVSQLIGKTPLLELGGYCKKYNIDANEIEEFINNNSSKNYTINLNRDGLLFNYFK